MANELILAVDDEAHILELLSFNLEASGYRVVTAATGEDALVVCAHERPAMVLLDIMLPGIDGMEVCRRLKSAPTTADIPIIMLTAKGDEVDKINDGDTLEISPEHGTIRDLDNGAEIRIPPLSPMMQTLIDKGGMVNYVKEQLKARGEAE